MIIFSKMLDMRRFLCLYFFTSERFLEPADEALKKKLDNGNAINYNLYK